MNPNSRIAGGVISAFCRRMRMVMVLSVSVMGRMVLDVEPQVGFIDFAAPGDFVGEFEIHRLHSFGSRRFRPFQRLSHIRHYGSIR